MIDIWHGYIPDADQALQLLIIVEWICSWAKDVHREGVIRCLSGPTARDPTPAETVISSQGDGSWSSRDVRSSSLVFRSSRPSTAIPETLNPALLSMDIDQIDESDGVGMAEDVPVDIPMESENGVDSDVGDVEEQKVVRNACYPVFRWKHLDIPDDETLLVEFLNALEGPDCLQNAARYIWDTLTDERYTSKISVKAVSELLQESIQHKVSEFASEEPIATMILCQRRLLETSWQVMCTFWCITCSQSAARLVAILAGVTESENFGLTYWRAHDCDCFLPAIACLERLEGKASAAAAISQDIYCVVASGSETANEHLECRKANRSVLQPRLLVLESLFTKLEGARQTKVPLAVSQSPPCGGPDPRLFEVDDLDGVHGVLLKRPEAWPGICPLWCFLAFGGTQQDTGTQIASALAKGAIFTGGALNNDDEELLLRWANEMLGVTHSIDARNQ